MTTFFIVEDNVLINELYRCALEDMGHKVIGQAFDGSECVEKFLEFHNDHGVYPDFVLMDYSMPKKNGLEAMREILKVKPDLKVVFISGDRSVKEAALSAGAGAFYSKPVDIEHLISTINTILGSE
jgi:two-component system chemotaxis response regulator CheY